jgi:hypothetical protein
MTKTKSILVFAALLAVSIASTAFGQSNNTAGPLTPNLIEGVAVTPTISGGLQEVWDATAASTNSAFAVGGGRGLHGNHNLIFVDYLYNFNDNAGLLLGFDDIARGSDFTSDGVAFVKGGFNVKADIAPLKRFGLPTFKVTPFVALLMYEANGNVGQIAVAGVKHGWRIGKSWDFNAGVFYESRSGGNSETDGKYLCGLLALTYGF